jgi:T5SS/PEP-CTERM-associated repeat protein
MKTLSHFAFLFGSTFLFPRVGRLTRSVLLVLLAFYVWAGSSAAAPVIYFTASPPDGTPGPTESYMGISYSTTIQWSVSQLEINNPNLYGGNYRSYLVPNAGNFNAQSAWDFGQLVTETAVGSISGESNQIGTILSGPTAIYAPTPASNDTVIFGYLGPNGTQSTPPLSATSTYVGQDAYTVGLGANTVAETVAGFFGEPADSKITLTLAGTYTSTADAELEGQQIVINGSGTFVTPDLRVAGNVNVTSGTLQGTTTIIDNGLNMANGVPLISGTQPTSTTLTLTGGSSILNASNYVAVGASANGPSTLDLENGAKANVGTIYLGYNAPNAQGNLTVNNATLTSTGILYAGYNASDDAVVKITGGGQLTDQGAIIGFGSQAAASVTVDGAGSKWTISSDPNYGYIDIGYASTGGNTLTVSNSGQVTSASFLAIGGYSGPDSTGGGSMTISSGGQVTSATSPPSGDTLGAAVGFGPNSNGTVLITGANSKWTIDQRLDLGYSSGSTGIVTVQGGGTLEVDSDIVRVGDAQGSTGTLTFDGTGGNPTFNFTTANSQLLIGDAGTGNFNVQGGAQISESASVIIGNQAGSTGHATVNGANSSWTINNSLVIGESGDGFLNINNGDTVTVQQGQNVILGDQAGSSGLLVLNGAGSQLIVTQASQGSGSGDALEIGNHGNGELDLENGASITFNNETDLGAQTDGTGQISVDGAGGMATFNHSLEVGQNATGTGSSMGGLLSITGGGQATVSGADLTIGEYEGSTGEIDVEGAGSTLNVSAKQVQVGGNGTGTLNVTNGGRFNALNAPLSVDGGVGTTSTVNITGIGAGASSGGQTQFTTGNLEIGEDGSGTLNASQGALLSTNGDVDIGAANATGSGTVVLDTKSVWNVSGAIEDGQMGAGNLTVNGGATLNITKNLYIGNGFGAGTVTVTGDASTLKANSIDLGNSSGVDSTLLIQNGGQVSDQVFYFGDASGSTTLTIDGKGSSGAPSTLTTGTLTLGGSDTITVSNGGLLTVNGASFQENTAFYVGATINITGAGSKLDASAAYTNLTGGVSINITNGGALVTGATDIATSSIQLNSTADASTWDVTGALNMVSATLSLTNNSTMTVSGAASMQNGTFTLNGSGASFQAPSLQVTQSGMLAVNGLAQVILGNTLSVNTAGIVDVTGGGTVSVGNVANQASGSVEVGAYSTLSNAATINGNVTIDPSGNYVGVGGVIHGTLTMNGKNTVYDGPGIETVNGDYVQGSTGVLDIGVEGTVAGSPTGYSVLDVTGNATLGGTLELSYLNGYKPTVGETLDFLNVGGTTSGAFTAVTLDGLPTLEINDTLVNGVLTITNVSRDYLNSTLAAQLSPNQRAVGGSLNAVANTASGDFNTVLTSIDNLSTAQQVGAAFDQLSPQRLQLFRNIAFDNFAFFSQQLDQHLANERDGAGGLDTSNFSYSDGALGSQLSQIKSHLLAWSPAPEPGLLSDSGSLLGGIAMTDPKDLGVSDGPMTDQSRWGTFIEGNVVLADLDSSADVAHANYTTGGVTLGADYRVTKNWTVGALFGYNHTDASLDEEGSSATVDTYSPGIYAAYADKGWYANGLFTYGYNSYTENRDIIFPGTNRTAIGAPQGNQYSGDLDGGYDFHFGQLTIGPSVGLNYVHLDINSFAEGGAGAAGLNVSEEGDDSLRSRVGFDARWNTKYLRTQFTYHLSAFYQHEFMDNSQGIASAFETPGAANFSVQGVAPDRDSALIDAGIDVNLTKNVDAYVDYQTEAGESSFFAQSVQAGVKIGF